MIRKESREPWGGEENRTDLTRQHMEMQAVFLQIFYKVLHSVQFSAYCRARAIPDGVAQRKLQPAQVLDNARRR
jgi:hypothetical protein